MSRLLKKTGDTGDKRTWHIGGKEVNAGKDAERYKGFGRRKPARKDATASATNEEALIDAPEATHAPGSAANDMMASLAGLDLSSPTTETPSNSLIPVDSAPSPVAVAAAPAPVAAVAPKPTPPAVTPSSRQSTLPLTHGADKWLSRLVYSNEGVLWEDGQLQVGIKSEFHGHLGRIALFFGNKISVSLESFTATIDVDDPDVLSVTLPKIPTSHISAASQIQQLVHVECKGHFNKPPILNISYLAGSLQTITLRLPIFLSKFIEPVQLSSTDFFERWKQIGGPPREAQKIFGIKLDPQGKVDVTKNKKVVAGSKFGVLESIDPNPNNIVAAGVLHMSTGGKVGCLLRLEPNTEAKVSCSLRASVAINERLRS